MQSNEIDHTRWTGETDFFKRRALREAETARFFATPPNVPQGGMRSYSDWLFDQVQAGLPTDIDPPSDVEPVDAWRTRIIGTPSSLSATAEAGHAVFRGASGERAARMAALRTITIGHAVTPEPRRGKGLSGLVEKILRLIP